MIDEKVVNDIRQSLDIVDVIKDYLPLTQKGKNFFCVCPFHNDHSPSMSISPEKQIYRCFTCGASGNVITFIMDYEKVSFKEALSILGKRCGINVKLSKDKKVNTEFDKYYSIYNTTMSFYKNNLNTASGSEARKYLKSRNITKEIIDEFNIGLSLNGGLSEVLSKKNKAQTLIDLGISYESNGKLYDLFKNRILFPIANSDGETVAFSGRIYDKSSESKYINSKETAIFKKGNILYNFDRAKEHIRKKHEVIICEGFMEVIRLATIGVRNVVALMGTSFTKEQLKMIESLKSNVVLNLDNDSAGKLAAYNIGTMLENIKINPTVIVFSGVKDTDELIVEKGSEAFFNAYNSRVSFIDYKLDYLKKSSDLKDATEISKYINEAIKNINKLNDDILKELKVKELSKEFDINEEVLRNKIIKSEVVTIKKEEVVKKKYDKYMKSQIRIIYLMLNYNEVILEYEDNIGFMPDERMNLLANEIIYFKNKYKSFDYAEFLTHLMNKPNIMNTLKEVMATEQIEEYTEVELDNYITVIKEYSVKMQIKRLTDKMKNSIDMEEKKTLAKRIENIKKEVLKW